MVTISEIFHFINPSMSKILDLDVSFRHFSPISSAQKGDVTFCTDVSENGITLICSSKASLIICHSDLFKKIKNSESNLIFVDFPKLTFIRCLNKFTSSLPHYGIHPSSIVETKELGKNISIGPFCYISKNVVIGDNVKILGNVCIYDDTIIGNNVTIQASTVIGTDGFGYELNEEKKYEKFPHIGGVEIHDCVEIGASNCIDKGALKNTIIESGTKTDNFVHIAHNVHLGKNCLLAAGVTTSGSCKIKDNVFIGTGSTLRDWITVGENSFIGVGSVVTKDIPDSTTVYGVPARKH